MKASELVMDEIEQAKALLGETNKEAFDTTSKATTFFVFFFGYEIVFSLCADEGTARVLRSCS